MSRRAPASWITIRSVATDRPPGATWVVLLSDRPHVACHTNGSSGPLPIIARTSRQVREPNRQLPEAPDPPAQPQQSPQLFAEPVDIREINQLVPHTGVCVRFDEHPEHHSMPLGSPSSPGFTPRLVSGVTDGETLRICDQLPNSIEQPFHVPFYRREQDGVMRFCS